MTDNPQDLQLTGVTLVLARMAWAGLTLLVMALCFWVFIQFAASARDETDLDRLVEETVRVVENTMQPAHVSLWLRQGD